MFFTTRHCIVHCTTTHGDKSRGHTQTYLMAVFRPTAWGRRLVGSPTCCLNSDPGTYCEGGTTS
jgi:hypothetical protein